MKEKIVEQLFEEIFSEKHIGFAKLKGELEAKGKSANYAGAIAHKIGVEKYGAKAMKHAAKTHTSLGESENDNGVEGIGMPNRYEAHRPTGKVTHHDNLSQAMEKAPHGTKIIGHYRNGIRQHVGTMNGKQFEGAKQFNPMDEAEDVDKHGNPKTKIDSSHPSYKAGHSFGKSFKKSKRFKLKTFDGVRNNVHQASINHAKEPSTLADKLHMQRQFKAGAHAALGLPYSGPNLKEDDSKQIQTKNFQEKCDYCGKKHDVGPCPAMQESEWKVDSPAYPGHTPDAPPAYECGGDWGEGPAPDAKSLLKKNHEDKGEPVAESEWGEPEEHEPGATYESEIQEDVDPDWHNHVKHGDKITIRVHNGIGRNGPEFKEKTGKAVIHNREQGGWALNMGGKHGTPGSAHAGNLVKHHKSKVHEEVVNEKKDAPICFCGHSATVHTASGCRSCKSEGHVRPQMAEHPFRRNSAVKTEETEQSHIDQTLQAAVDWLANRVNVRGITESAMPYQEVRIKDKFSPALAEASTLKYANEVKPEERHPWHEDAVKAGLKHDSTWKKGATTIHTYSPDHHWKSGAQLVTTARKGKPDKHSWRAGAFDKGGDDLKSLHSHINAGVQHHDALMAHHKAGTGPFAPGK